MFKISTMQKLLARLWAVPVLLRTLRFLRKDLVQNSGLWQRTTVVCRLLVAILTGELYFKAY
jgi:hypothetical protein